MKLNLLSSFIVLLSVCSCASVDIDRETSISNIVKLCYPDNTMDIWHGYRRTSFEFEGHDAWIVEPDIAPAEGLPWSWTMQWADDFVERTGVTDMLEAGYYHVTIDIYDDMGNDESLKVASDFQKYLTDCLGFAKEARLIGMSLGGFFSVRYAAAYPQNVYKIYLDAPLLAFRDGSDGTGWWANHKAENGKWSEDPRMPVNMAPILAQEQIPVLLLYGAQDDTVNPKTNCEPFIQKMEENGGEITVIKREDYGHHPHGMDDDERYIISAFFK